MVESLLAYQVPRTPDRSGLESKYGGWPSWLRRQIVALKIEGSNPFIHPIFFFTRFSRRCQHWDVAKR